MVLEVVASEKIPGEGIHQRLTKMKIPITHRGVKRPGDATIAFSDFKLLAADTKGASAGTWNAGFGIETPALEKLVSN
jgi:hypothetical protein